jgi:hypothetical protein
MERIQWSHWECAVGRERRTQCLIFWKSVVSIDWTGRIFPW